MKLKLPFFKDEHANANTIIMLVTVAVGILALAIILTLGPGIGYSINTATSGTIPASSQWSSNYNSSGNASGVTIANGALNGSQLWVNTTPMLGSGAMVVIAAIIIAILLGAFIFGRTRQ